MTEVPNKRAHNQQEEKQEESWHTPNVRRNKEFVDKIPRTLIRITAKGKKALKHYRDKMKTVIDSLSQNG